MGLERNQPNSRRGRKVEVGVVFSGKVWQLRRNIRNIQCCMRKTAQRSKEPFIVLRQTEKFSKVDLRLPRVARPKKGGGLIFHEILSYITALRRNLPNMITQNGTKYQMLGYSSCSENPWCSNSGSTGGGSRCGCFLSSKVFSLDWRIKYLRSSMLEVAANKVVVNMIPVHDALWFTNLCPTWIPGELS